MPKQEPREQVQQIPLSEIHPFRNHPFKVLDDEAMQRTVESVAQYGVLAPLIARPRPEGGYEIISGHRRQHAAELAGLDTLPVIVREMTDDAAVILMVDSNLQRENILPSERAFAYKMKLEALKNQGARSDLTSCQVGTKFRADESLAEDTGESARNVQRFIRLTNLIPELLDLVDEKKWYKEVKPAYINWDKRQGDYDTYLLKMVDVYTEAILGLDKYHIDYIAKKVIEQKGDRVYTFSRERIKWHKEQGDIVIAISGSPIELVKEMSSKYNMDDYRGTIYELDSENKYNGNIIPNYEDRPVSESIKYQIIAAGGLSVYSLKEADMVLMVNVPYNNMKEARSLYDSIVNGTNETNLDYTVGRNLIEYIEYIKHLISINKCVAIADIAYANGGDINLFNLLKNENLLFKVDSYAGWNTAANTLGTCIPLAMIHNIYKDSQAFFNFMGLRYLEDVGYMSFVRFKAFDLFKNEFAWKEIDGKEN